MTPISDKPDDPHQHIRDAIRELCKRFPDAYFRKIDLERGYPEDFVEALDLKKGDKVLFGKYSGTEVKVDGEDLLVMREDDVMAVIEK
jgi:hypothetical protein